MLRLLLNSIALIGRKVRTMSAQGTRCGIHHLELEEVRPGKWLCPEPECTHITTDAMMVQVRDLLWAQEHGMVHPEAMEIQPPKSGQ